MEAHIYDLDEANERATLPGSRQAQQRAAPGAGGDPFAPLKQTLASGGVLSPRMIEARDYAPRLHAVAGGLLLSACAAVTHDAILTIIRSLTPERSTGPLSAASAQLCRRGAAAASSRTIQPMPRVQAICGRLEEIVLAIRPTTMPGCCSLQRPDPPSCRCPSHRHAGGRLRSRQAALLGAGFDTEVAPLRPQDDCEQVLALKSFDYRVLNLLLFAMRGADPGPGVMEFLSASEMLVELSDDLYDYEEDVVANSFNIYRCFVALYGPTYAAPQLAQLIQRHEAIYEAALARIAPDIALRFKARCDEAARSGGGSLSGSWQIPSAIVDENLFRLEALQSQRPPTAPPASGTGRGDSGAVAAAARRAPSARLGAVPRPGQRLGPTVSLAPSQLPLSAPFLRSGTAGPPGSAGGWAGGISPTDAARSPGMPRQPSSLGGSRATTRGAE